MSNLEIKNIRDLVSKKVNKEDEEKIAVEIADYINSSEESKDLDQDFVDVVNLFIYEHSLSNQVGLNDYVIVDYLELNKYIIKKHRQRVDLFSSSILDLDLDENYKIKKDKDISFSFFKELVAINAISASNPDLANKIFYKLTAVKNRRFFRLLGYYTGLYCLHLKIEINNETNSQKIDSLMNKFNYMFSIYEDFTVNIPIWYKSLT